MKTILYTANSGYPSSNIGGPNKIIYEIIKNIDYRKYNPSYLSYDYFDEKYLSKLRMEKTFLKNGLSTKKKITKYLFENIFLYKFLTTNSLYLKYHILKKKKYYLGFDSQNYDIIHAHDALVLPYLRNISSKTILTLHNKGSIYYDLMNNANGIQIPSWMINLYCKLELESFNISDYVSFPSIAAKELFLNDRINDKLNEEKIRIIYNGIDINYIRNRSKNTLVIKKYALNDKHKIRILNVANHIKPKNISIIIDAINVLVNNLHKDVVFINAGFGPDTPGLISKIDKYGLNKYVKLLGKVSNDDILDLMSICDYFVMPSERVVFDMVILEALASGICVIASNNGGNKEILKDGYNGYLLRDLTADEIVIKILNTDKERTRSNAEKTASEFSIEIMISKYMKLYEEK